MAAVQKKPIYQAEELFAKEVIKRAKIILSKKRKNASKELYNSITYKISDKGVEFSYVEQGEFVESGRRKGAKMPPMSVLEKWAKQKGLEQFRDDKGKYLSSKTRAYLIGRSISKKGIKPLAWFSDPLKLMLHKFPDVLQEAIVLVLENQATQMANELSK
jgi:hypothetical protein